MCSLRICLAEDFKGRQKRVLASIKALLTISLGTLKTCKPDDDDDNDDDDDDDDDHNDNNDDDDDCGPLSI